MICSVLRPASAADVQNPDRKLCDPNSFEPMAVMPACSPRLRTIRRTSCTVSRPPVRPWRSMARKSGPSVRPVRSSHTRKAIAAQSCSRGGVQQERQVEGSDRSVATNGTFRLRRPDDRRHKPHEDLPTAHRIGVEHGEEVGQVRGDRGPIRHVGSGRRALRPDRRRAPAARHS